MDGSGRGTNWDGLRKGAERARSELRHSRPRAVRSRGWHRRDKKERHRGNPTELAVTIKAVMSDASRLRQLASNELGRARTDIAGAASSPTRPTTSRPPISAPGSNRPRPVSRAEKLGRKPSKMRERNFPRNSNWETSPPRARHIRSWASAELNCSFCCPRAGAVRTPSPGGAPSSDRHALETNSIHLPRARCAQLCLLPGGTASSGGDGRQASRASRARRRGAHQSIAGTPADSGLAQERGLAGFEPHSSNFPEGWR